MADDKTREAARDGGFLARWSDRKRAVAAEDAAAAEPPVSADDEAAREAERTANRAAAEAVDLETLTYDSDFSIFLKDGVPDALKNRALRKLWTSNPLLANVDGLNDYDENFADPALNVFKSAWKAGRGYLFADEDTDKAPAAPDAEPERQSAPDDTDPPAAAADPAPLPEDTAEPAITETSPDIEPEEPAPPPRVSIRRRLMG